MKDRSMLTDSGAVDEFTDWFTSQDGKSDNGYYVSPKASFLMQAELVNYLKTDQSVYIQTDIEWLPGKVGTDTIKTSMSVTGKSIQRSRYCFS
jgi:hypothetical protein